MSFLAKCYNGHKILLEDDMEGETVECPWCGEDFVAVSEYEELGKVIERTVPYNTRGYIHIGTGLFIGGLITYLVKIATQDFINLFWRMISFLTIIIGCLYLIRGFFELFKNVDPFWKVKQIFFAYYYILWKKIKFFRR